MTKKAFREVLLELLQTKPLNKITITEICEMADMNRSTFYAHYVEVGDLLRDIGNEILSNLPKVYDMGGSKRKSVRASDLELFFSYVKKNAFEFRILLIDSDSKYFCDRLKSAILHYYLSVNHEYLTQGKEFQLIYSVNGAVGMMVEWIKRDFPFEPKEFTKMVLENVRSMFELESIEI